jgi:hypothetical protein
MNNLLETFRNATKAERSIMVRKARVVGMRHGRMFSGFDAIDAERAYAPCTNLWYAYFNGKAEAERIKARKL